jgi:hypothetical protein
VSPDRRDLEALLGDLAEAVDAAAEIVALGKDRRDAERPLRLAGEAVVGRLGDIATKLPDELVAGNRSSPGRRSRGCGSSSTTPTTASTTSGSGEPCETTSRK